MVDEAASRVRLQKETLPPEIREAQKKYEEVSREKKGKIESQDFEAAVGLRDKEEKLLKKLNTLKKEWVEKQKKVESVVTSKDISYIVSRMTGIPTTRIEEQESMKLLNMEEELHKRIVGQDEAIKAVTKAIKRSRAGLRMVKKPIGTFLFLGPTGVGKTELARALTEFLFGQESSLIRLDMSEYRERFSASRLTGAPPGYVGYEEGGQLTEQVRRKPYSVVLLDEIEKAHSDIFHMLLQVMDDGHLSDSYGRIINFKNTVFIMTSNISSRMIGKNTSLGFQKTDRKTSFDRLKDTIMIELKRVFNPEFLNRIDDIIIFHPLEMEHIAEIVDLFLKRLNAHLLDERGLTLEMGDDVKQWLVKEGYDPAYGARPLKRTMEKYIEDPVSEEILRGKFRDGGVVVVKREGDQLVFIDKKDLVISNT